MGSLTSNVEARPEPIVAEGAQVDILGEASQLRVAEIRPVQHRERVEDEDEGQEAVVEFADDGRFFVGRGRRLKGFFAFRRGFEGNLLHVDGGVACGPLGLEGFDVDHDVEVFWGRELYGSRFSSGLEPLFQSS